MNFMGIPQYNSPNKLHKELAELSKKAHNKEGVEEIEEKIDKKVSELYGISKDRLRSVQEYLKKTNV